MTLNSKIPYGSCIVWAVPPSLNGFVEKIFGFLQNFFTGQPETHASMVMSEYPEKPGEYYEYEISVTARITLFGYPHTYADVYDILAPETIKVEAMTKLIRETRGKVYGFLQTFIFIVRWVLEKFGRDGRRLWNPFRFLHICSEGQYMYLYDIAERMDWRRVLLFMRQWKPDVFHAGDCRTVLDFLVLEGYAKKYGTD